jgi:hypothetical protein
MGDPLLGKTKVTKTIIKFTEEPPAGAWITLATFGSFKAQWAARIKSGPQCGIDPLIRVVEMETTNAPEFRGDEYIEILSDILPGCKVIGRGAIVESTGECVIDGRTVKLPKTFTIPSATDVIKDLRHRLLEAETLLRDKREAFTFEEFVEEGRKVAENTVDGVPWAFAFRGFNVTHENDDCYLILVAKGGTLRFDRGDLLVIEGTKIFTYTPKAAGQ